MTRGIALLCGVVALMSSMALATIFGSVRGIIHDPQHRPIQDAMVMLKSKSSEWTKSASTDANGEFAFHAVPLGDYSISVASPGFAQASQNLVVNSGTEPVVHSQLSLAGAKSDSGVLSSRRQPPLVLQMPLHPLEHESIDNVSDCDDQNHDRDDGAHVIQVTTHHQHLAEAETQVKHFGGDQ